MNSESKVKEEIINIIRKKGSISMDELVNELGWKDDKRLLRRIVADMVRNGIIVKEPDYDKRKLVFKLPE